MDPRNSNLNMFSFLPDGNNGFQPCPDVLTEEEVIRFLRLDLDDNNSDPAQTLKHYRDKGQLVAIRIGRRNRYRLEDLKIFLARKSEEKQ